jgi:hypothetical protein
MQRDPGIRRKRQPAAQPWTLDRSDIEPVADEYAGLRIHMTVLAEAVQLLDLTQLMAVTRDALTVRYCANAISIASGTLDRVGAHPLTRLARA